MKLRAVKKLHAGAAIFEIVFLIIGFIAVNYIRTPIFFKLRVWDSLTIVLLSLVFLFSHFRSFQKQDNIRYTYSILKVLALIILIILVGYKEIRFYIIKYRVINYSANEVVQELGKHFIVGYTDFNEATLLAKTGKIAGVFITQRNVGNKTKEQLKVEIDALQKSRKNNGLPQLFVATDQEGGLVSRLSPPLSTLPQLSSLIHYENCPEKDLSCFTQEEELSIKKYARSQAEELSSIGVNLNFAPVVDINYGTTVPNDLYTSIDERALARDPTLVAKISLAYSEALEAAGVIATLKHFPGLGRAVNDTHLSSAHILSSVQELTSSDWIPFHEVLSKTQAWMILSHAALDAIDSKHPVSFSYDVINRLIRNEWKHDGIIITDDFSMQPVFYNPKGVEGASVMAFNAGVDFILISYDKDVYYPVMDSLVKAYNKGYLNVELLKQSNSRIQSVIARIQNR